MSAPPYIPLYIDDYDAATAHLSAAEDGVYGRLLRLAWRTPGCSLPNDPVWIARKIRLSSDEFERIAAPVLAEFFTLSRGRLSQRRLKREFDDIARKKTARKLAGKKGGISKALKEQEKSASNATVLLADTRAFPEPEPEPEVSTVEDKSSTASQPDHDNLAWTTGVDLLMRQGEMGERAARSFFGRLLSQNGLLPRDLLASCAQAAVNNTRDPQGYLTKAAQAIAKRQAPAAKAVGFV